MNRKTRGPVIVLRRQDPPKLAPPFVYGPRTPRPKRSRLSVALTYLPLAGMVALGLCLLDVF